ncbi:hypothetical protein [Burkholderia lata]|uniref:hypothetical protein n=1 Tax=Burkholderia lata (strain ATCC 17760 / DSM 23089 / LMG 22485 / NCIMB 9086 / R18194 / 383) TaxID=482957 RepID=UPI001C2DFE26|nr:hypothetical protein [Burkholderia lata]
MDRLHPADGRGVRDTIPLNSHDGHTRPGVSPDDSTGPRPPYRPIFCFARHTFRYGKRIPAPAFDPATGDIACERGVRDKEILRSRHYRNNVKLQSHKKLDI